MNDPFKLAKLLNPRVDDILEKKKLDEHDAIKKGEVTIIPCRHQPTITHTNGDIECLSCHKMLKETKPKWRDENGTNSER